MFLQKEFQKEIIFFAYDIQIRLNDQSKMTFLYILMNIQE